MIDVRIISVLILISSALCYSPAYARQYTQTAFSPFTKAIKLIERTLYYADDTIDVAAYSFTSFKIANALIAARKRGVQVRMVLDKTNISRHYKAVTDLYNAGIAIRINYHYAVMHSKYMVIDGKTVETGSFNYTASAEYRNAENIIVIRNNKKLARQYHANWQTLWNDSEMLR